MKLQKAIKKIVALGVGVSMMGATLLGATAAADLGNYPSPFVADGVFDGMMVVGDDAAPADIIGVTDIAMSLQFSSTITRTVDVAGASGVTISGDAAEVGESNDLLELYEQLGDVKETFTDADLEALQSGVVSTDKGTTDYNQYLRLQDDAGATGGFPTATTGTNYVVYSENEDEEVGDFLYFEDGEVMFEYELEFEEGMESDIVDNNGDDALCGTLDDLEDEVVNILGSKYAIINAEVADNDGDSACDGADKVTLELMGGDVTDTLEEGETKTYNIDGKDYEVTLIIVSDTTEKTKFKVNGEITDELRDGDTDVLNDGTEIGIRSVLPNEAGETAGGDIVEFYLGANKLKLVDGDMSDDDYTTSNSVDINEENINAASVVIKATSSADSELRLNNIKYRLEADSNDGDLYVPAGHGIREYQDDSEGMLTDEWDVRYEGLMDTGTSEIKLSPSSDDKYRLEFTNLQGQEYSFMLLDESGNTGHAVIGKDKGTDGNDAGNHFDQDHNEDELFIYDDDMPIAKDDYFPVTEEGALGSGVADEKSFTNILRFDSIDTNDLLVTFSDLAGGSRDATYDSTTCEGTLVIAGNTYGFKVISDGDAGSSCTNEIGTGSETTSSTLAVIDFDQDGDGHLSSATGDPVKMVAEGGAIIDFDAGVSYGNCADDHSLLITTLGGEFDEGSDGLTLAADGHDETVELCLDAGSTTAGEVDVDVEDYYDTVTPGSSLDMHTLSDNDNVDQGMTNYGALIKQVGDDNDADAVTIEYPLSQRGAQVFVVSGATTTAGGAGAGQLTYEEPQRIEIGSAVLASEVADPTSTNIISVGGSCINEVTAELLGLTYPACGEASGLAEGEAVVKLVESGDNVAVVVAGWNADDTTRATRVLADFGKWQDAGKLAGNEVKVTGTSLTNYDVTPVSE